MTELFYSVLNMSISASVLILAVLLLRFLFRKAPKWVNVLLWGLVAVRLICPVALSTPFSLMPKADWLPQQPAYSQEDPAPVSPDRIPENPILNPSTGGDNTVHHDPVEPQIQIHRGVSVPFALSCIWLAGIGVMLGYMLASYIRVVRHIRTANRFRDNIYLSDGVSSPFVFGLMRPRIYLPEKMDAVSMNYVISHEEAHLRRLDHLWKPLGFLLLSVHWFNPLVWLGYLLLCRDIEMACDEYVVRRMNEAERVEYSEALLECSVNRRMVSACPLAFGEVGVKERIKSVLHYKKPAFWIVVLAVMACVAAAACFLTNPTQEEKPNNNEIVENNPETPVSTPSAVAVIFPSGEYAQRVKGWFTGTDIDWTLAYTHADWMDLDGHFTDKTVPQTANLVLYQETWYLVLETPGQPPRIEKLLTVPTAKGYLLAHDLTGDGLDELLCVFSVLGTGNTYSVYGYQLSHGESIPILTLLDGWNQELGIQEIDQNALGFYPSFGGNYQMTWKNRLVDKSCTFDLSAMGNVSEWFDAHGVGKPDHLFTDIGQELHFTDSNEDGIDELVCGGSFSYGGHLYTVGRLSASLQYDPQTRGFEVVDVSYRPEDGAVPDDSPDDTVHGEWNYKFSDENGRQFYGLTFDTGNQEMKFEYGYYESEYVNRYFGSYTLDPVSQVITATLHDSSIVHTDPDITLKFQLEYSTGENVLVWDILSCDVGKYQHLIGNPLAFKKGNPFN